MRISILPVTLLFFINGLIAQKSELTTPALDFGDIGADDQRYGDVRLTNFGDKKVYVLRIEQSPEIVYQLNSESIQPDSTLVVRVQVNPKKTGQFDYVVRIYMSDQNEPVLLKISGNVKELPRDRTLTAQKCPDFNAVPAGIKPAELTIITVDAENGDRLSKSTVTIIRNGNPAGAWITGRDGDFKQDFKSGYFYFFAAHDGYFPKEAGVYINPEIREVTIPLKKDPAARPPERLAA